MHAKLAAGAVVVLLAGCQSGNPFAAFGPATIPAPGMQTPAPYYSATATASTPHGDASPADTILSPLANSLAASPGPVSDQANADASDQQPIRIVENPAAQRTATAPSSAIPSLQQIPANVPGDTPARPAPQPSLNRLRGFIPAGSVPGSSNPSATHLDPRVAPAGYQQPGTLAPPQTAAGQWKAR